MPSDRHLSFVLSSNLIAVALIALCLCLGADCGGRGSDNQPPTGPTPGPATVTDADLAQCVDTINAYRAAIRKPPMERDARLEQIAGRAAEQDYLAGDPYQHFALTGGEGYANAENEIITSATQHGTLRDGINFGLKSFWNEGLSGGHYQNMVKYSRLGCGVYIDGDNLSLAVDFR